ncbi:MAG TPA: electron transport complex subunit RsxC [Planctomycetota bacterium]|nr:electron transport complex subunit RsxC [Planctomycetota bacterium]
MKNILRKTFRGGVHPGDYKELSKDQPITPAPLPKQVILPVSQHIGAPAKPIVAKGDTVKKGQVVAEAAGFVSVPVHASISGTVSAIEPRPHALGQKVNSIIIDSDGQDEWLPGLLGENDIDSLKPDEIKQKVLAAGIAGLGGATFPTHVKLSPPADKPVDSVIINAVECEPFLTCDYRIMLERPADVVSGLRLVMKAVGAKTGYIAVEANKLDAYEKLRDASAAWPEISMVLLEVKYPQGAELQLIEAVLGKQVPSGKLPSEVGAYVQNAGTAAAIYEACRFNKPLVERCVTVTGTGAGKPANLMVRLGTPIASLMELCEASPDIKKLILGGPMMGLAQSTSEVSVTKGTSGILLLVGAQEFDYEPCIRCGRCVEHCPMRLVPSDLSIICEAGRVEDMLASDIMDCKECGCCAYVCPARRPIVQWIKLGKAHLARLKAKKPA